MCKPPHPPTLKRKPLPHTQMFIYKLYRGLFIVKQLLSGRTQKLSYFVFICDGGFSVYHLYLLVALVCVFVCVRRCWGSRGGGLLMYRLFHLPSFFWQNPL